MRRDFLGILFDCCGVYARVYKSADGRHYAGRCPRCTRPIRFQVGEGGSGRRFWRVS